MHHFPNNQAMRRTYSPPPGAARNAHANRSRLRETVIAVAASSMGRQLSRSYQLQGVATEHGNVIVTALAILIPIAALLLALQPEIRSLIDQRPGDYLVLQAESVRAQTVERLSAADHLLRIVSTDVARSDTLNPMSTSTRLDAFDNVALLLNGGQSIVLKGNAPILGNLNASTTAHLSQGRTALVTEHTGESAKPALLRAVQLATGGQSHLLVGELSPGYLWTHGGTANTDYSLCVSDASNRSVYCEQSPPLASAQTSVPENGMTAVAAGNPLPDERMAASARIDLTQPFAAEDWIIAVHAKNPPALLSSNRSTLAAMKLTELNRALAHALGID